MDHDADATRPQAEADAAAAADDAAPAVDAAPADDAAPAVARDAEQQLEVRPASFEQFDPPAAAPGAAAGSLALLAGVELPITVELGRVSMQIRELLDTGPGSVIELDRTTHEPVDILAGGRLIARGEVVVVGQSIGVRVTELVQGTDKEVDHAEDQEGSAIAG